MRILWMIVSAVGVVILLSLLAPNALQSLARSVIEEGFETRSLADAEAEAISIAAPGLSRMDEAEAILSVSEAHLTPLLKAGLSRAAAEHGIMLDNLEILLGNQGIRVEGVADIMVPGRDISATVKFLGDAKIGLTQEKLVITPAFSSVEIQELRAGWLFFPNSVAGLLSSAITTAIEAINSTVDPVQVDVPAFAFQGDNVNIGTAKIDIPSQQIAASALLVDEDRILWIGQTAPASEPVAPVETFSAYRDRFRSAARSLLEGLPIDGFRLAPGVLGQVYARLVDSQPLDERARIAVERARANAGSMYRTDLAIYRPDFALFLPAGQVREAVEPLILDTLKAEAGKTGIEILEAGLDFEAGYLAAFVEGNLAFQKPAPGQAKVRVTITAIPSFVDGRLEIRPGIQEVIVLDAKAEGYDLGGLLVSVNGIAAGLVSSLDAALPAIPIDVEPYSVGVIDLSKQSHGYGVTFSRDTLDGPTVALSNASVFISKTGLFLLAEVTSDATSLVAPVYGTPEIAPGLDGLEAYALAFAQPGHDVPDPRIGGAALSWSRLAELINAEFADMGDLGAHVRNRIPRAPFAPTKIELVERPNYQCRGPGDCPFQSCASECRRQNCSYSCPSVGTRVPCPTWREPFRWCYQSVEEPVCVAGRETCRAGREAGYGACVLACNTAANTNVAACQAQNVARQAGCELGKRIQDLGAEIGGVGVIGGDAGAAPDVNVGISRLLFNPDQLSGQLTAQLSGTVRVDGSVSFVPYDMMNVLGCPKGKVDFSTDATLPRQAVTLNISVEKDPDPDETDGVDDLDLLATIAPFSIKADLNPRPAEAILANNPHLPFVCNPIIGAGIVGLTIVGRASALAPDDLVRGASDDVAAILSGKFEEPVEATEIAIPIETEELKIGDSTYRLVPDIVGTAIAMTLGQ